MRVGSWRIPGRGRGISAIDEDFVRSTERRAMRKHGGAKIKSPEVVLGSFVSASSSR